MAIKFTIKINQGQANLLGLLINTTGAEDLLEDMDLMGDSNIVQDLEELRKMIPDWDGENNVKIK